MSLDCQTAVGDVCCVADFTPPAYSIDDVRAAGVAIGAGLPWPDDAEGAEADRVRHIFRIAHNWREAHGYPLKRVRAHLIGGIRAGQLDGFTAARVKRMASIRPKLQKQFGLDEIQDLGGCRCVMTGMDGVAALISRIKTLPCVRLDWEDDYISKPKRSGYRSHHVIVQFNGQDDESRYDGLRLEVQVRTQLQHAWATANEAIGLYLGQKLKAGQGDDRWLRFFALMSGEIADIEGLPVSRHVPGLHERRAEIVSLSRALQAPKTLSACASAFKQITTTVMPHDKPQYWLVTYRAARKEVEVSPYYGVKESFDRYDKIEETEVETVLIDGTKLESLKVEFPNYFGDVTRFQEILEGVSGGRSLSSYSLKPQGIAPKPPQEKPDLSWLRPRR